MVCVDDVLKTVCDNWHVGLVHEREHLPEYFSHVGNPLEFILQRADVVVFLFDNTVWREKPDAITINLDPNECLDYGQIADKFEEILVKGNYTSAAKSAYYQNVRHHFTKAVDYLREHSEPDIFYAMTAMYCYYAMVGAIKKVGHVAVRESEVEITERSTTMWNADAKYVLDRWSKETIIQLSSEAHPYIYAVYGDRTVGFVTGSLQEGRTAKLEGLAVGIPYHRNGIGTRLLNQFEQIFKGRADKVEGEAVHDNLKFFLNNDFSAGLVSAEHGDCVYIRKHLQN